MNGDQSNSGCGPPEKDASSLWRLFLQRLLPAAVDTYPRQFWLLFWGMLVSSVGASMIWPFLMIYVSERLDLPLASAGLLMTVNSTAGLVSALVAGPVIDRAGRKWVMVVSLVVNAASTILLSLAGTLAGFIGVMALAGAFNPLYRVGADAMMADLIPTEQRLDAYSLMRLSNNLGVALGPTLGGFVAAVSYQTAFYLAAGAMLTYAVLLLLRGSETLPPEIRRRAAQQTERLGGYGEIFRHRPFMAFILTFMLNQMAASLIWLLMAVYAKQSFGVTENLYGFIPATNALLIVLLQMPVTERTRRIPPLWSLAAGSLLYAVAVGSVALAQGFWGFWASMVVLTLGELVLIPNATTYAANLAPPEKRGRTMSLYGLCWQAAAGVGPLGGGYLNDHFGGRSTWYGGGLVGLVSALLFAWMARRRP